MDCPQTVRGVQGSCLVHNWIDDLIQVWAEPMVPWAVGSPGQAPLSESRGGQSSSVRLLRGVGLPGSITWKTPVIFPLCHVCE